MSAKHPRKKLFLPKFLYNLFLKKLVTYFAITLKRRISHGAEYLTCCRLVLNESQFRFPFLNSSCWILLGPFNFLVKHLRTCSLGKIVSCDNLRKKGTKLLWGVISKIFFMLRIVMQWHRDSMLHLIHCFYLVFAAQMRWESSLAPHFGKNFPHELHPSWNTRWDVIVNLNTCRSQGVRKGGFLVLRPIP